MSVILKTKNLSKSFGAVTAAANINVEIHEREIVGVIGANGAGKTTFINMVTGYLKPSAGEIDFRNRNILGLSPRHITKIGISRSFQVPQLFSELTALENIVIAHRLMKANRLEVQAPLKTQSAVDAARGSLAEFGIADYAEAQVTALPQGTRKLLDIAMAMAGSPDLLLLDEPTSGVAMEEKFPLMDTVMEAVKRSRAACLFVEHDMEIVARYTDRVLAFYDGHIIADAPTEEALSNKEVREYVIGTELHREKEGKEERTYVESP